MLMCIEFRGSGGGGSMLKAVMAACSFRPCSSQTIHPAQPLSPAPFLRGPSSSLGHAFAPSGDGDPAAVEMTVEVMQCLRDRHCSPLNYVSCPFFSLVCGQLMSICVSGE